MFSLPHTLENTILQFTNMYLFRLLVLHLYITYTLSMQNNLCHTSTNLLKKRIIFDNRRSPFQVLLHLRAADIYQVKIKKSETYI